MIVKHRLNLDLTKRGVTQRIDAVQDDCCSRALEIRLFAGGMAYIVPEDCTVLVRYQKPDGIGGAYDTLPDGSCAWSIADSVLTVVLAPQVCTAAGTVELAVTLLRETVEISTFMLLVDVQPAPGATQSSREYVNIQAFLPQPGGLIPGQYLVVKAVDTYGNATVIGSGDGGAASVAVVGAEWLSHKEAPRVTEAPGSSQWNRKYILGIPAGEPGYTPVRGLDYWTAEDYAVMQQENRDYLAGELAKRTQTAPQFADTLSECVDSGKIYVLPDGYIYAYMQGAWRNTGHQFMPKGEKGDPGEDGKNGISIAQCHYAFATLPTGRAKGDINGDGVIDEEDVAAIGKHATGAAVITEEAARWAADVDGDGYVDSFDSALIQNYLAGKGNYPNYAADYHGAWQFDKTNSYYYFDIPAAGMTADCGGIIVPSVTFKDSFIKAIPVAGAMRLCFKACPTEHILCRILYSPEISGVVVGEGVGNSFLDIAKGEPGYTPVKGIDYFTEADKAEIVSSVLAVLNPAPAMISFRINSVPFQAEEGMTWGAWIESGYNTGGYVLTPEEGYVAFLSPDDGDYYGVGPNVDDGEYSYSNDVIIADYDYTEEA